jgi:hypothetical protein
MLLNVGQNRQVLQPVLKRGGWKTTLASSGALKQMDADGRTAWRVVHLTAFAAFNSASHELSRE